MDWYSSFQLLRFLTRFLYAPYALHAFTLFSAQELLMIIENTLNSEVLYINLVLSRTTRKAYEN